MQEKLKARTKQFAVDVFRFCEKFPDDPQCWVIEKQLMRSASSVGANYRAACRAQSRAAFVAKMAIVEEEADESLFWLEMVEELAHAPPSDLQPLKQEASEILAIMAKSKKSARENG
jgi:four helix bundle protein